MNKPMTQLADFLGIRHDNKPREVLAEQVCAGALECISELTARANQLGKTIVESAVRWDNDDNNSMNSYPGFYCQYCSMRHIESKKDIKHDPACPVMIAVALGPKKQPMRKIKLTSVGQIKRGSKVHCTYKGKACTYKAKEILNAGTDIEEVLLSRKKNLYFITSMAIDGTSWAKDVYFESTQEHDQ